MGHHPRPVFGADQSGRDELNLAEFPLALLTETAPAGVKTLEFGDRFTDRRTLETFDRRVIITACEKFGLPRAGDEAVLIGLIQLTREINNFTDPRIEFSRYRLLKIMNWPDTPKSYARVRISIKRWLGVTLYFERAWFDKSLREFVNKEFHILDNHDPSHRQQVPNRVKWNDVPFESLRNGWLKPLDLELYFRKLTLPLARRLYRFLDKRFHHGRQEYELRHLAFEKAGMSRNYNIAQMRRAMGPAILQLECSGFLHPLPASERFFKRDATWYVLLQPSQAPKLNRPISFEA